MHESSVFEVRVGAKGRLVVPALLRREVGIEAGDVLLASAEGDRLVLERRDAILARVRNRYRAVPEGVSLVDDLIAQRRAEARRENGA